MIGLFAIRSAIGPLIILVLFTILTILAHLSLSEALDPLHSFLPRSLETEEEIIQSKEEESSDSRTLLENTSSRSKLEAIWKWFHPNFYRDYAALRQKIRRDLVEIKYSEAEMRDAYFEPCITSPTPKLWIPRDKWGISQREIRELNADSDWMIPVTDEGAHLDEKNRIVWDKYDPSLPLWELRVLY